VVKALSICQSTFMFNALNGLRVIECASFIAAPSCCLHLAQLGAEIVRIDAIGGGPDFKRWPVAPNGSSLYWEGLNKGKKSISIDFRRPEGQKLVVDLITAPDPASGLLVTNFPAKGFLSHSALAAKRSDLITVRVMGWADGTTALDYTVNAAVGYPLMTGPIENKAPVNHVLPAWDLLTGAHATFALLAAERYRRETGAGQEVRVPLGDVAISTIGHLGQIAEVEICGSDRPRFGNALFGAFGRDFPTADGSLVMLVAITPRQWKAIVNALSIHSSITALETELELTFAEDETLRFQHRERLFSIVEAATKKSNIEDLTQALVQHGVCWSKYQTVSEAVATDRHFFENPILSKIQQPSEYSYLAPGSAVNFTGLSRETPARAPKLGEHTEEILTRLLGMPDVEIARLHDQGVVASAS
jgi:2-methylfumaryl-CoA isomerase